MRTETPAPPAPAPAPPREPRGSRGAQLERWAWLMLPAMVAALVVADVLGVWFLHLLDLREGDLLLMAGGAGAWAAELLVTLIVATPPVAGVVCATRALVLHGPRRAWGALLLNALVVAWVLYVFVDDIRMSYFPG